MLVFNGYCSWKGHLIKICGSRCLCFLKSSTQFSVPSTSLKKSVCWNLYNKFPSFSLSLTCSGSVITSVVFLLLTNGFKTYWNSLLNFSSQVHVCTYESFYRWQFLVTHFHKAGDMSGHFQDALNMNFFRKNSSFLTHS